MPSLMSARVAREACAKSGIVFSIAGVFVMIPQFWTATHNTELDEASVRSAFQPAEKYRISRFRYPAGTVTSGAMIEGTCLQMEICPIHRLSSIHYRFQI